MIAVFLQVIVDPAASIPPSPRPSSNYVRRSHEPVILNDARTDAGGFSSDEYLLRVRPRSVLCMAIQRQDQLLAVLYLENNLAAGVFTPPERRTMIELLGVTGRVSFENSTIYEVLRKSEALLNATQQIAKVGGWGI